MNLSRPDLLVPRILACLALIQAVHAQCEVLKLTGPPPDPSGPRYGFSCSLQGDRMAVGIPHGADLSGAVDVFERKGAAWVCVQTLTASDSQDIEEFGYSVAIDGDTLVVGATHDGFLFAKGAAYVFERQTDGAWLETAKLLPPDDGWAFGWAVDVSDGGNRIAVGAKGASSLSGGKGLVVTFEKEGGVWVKKATIKPTISAGGDGFGASLDLEGDRLVVGAPYAWAGGSFSAEGLAFVFERTPPGYVWGQKAVFSPDDLANLDQFGRDVALDGDRIVVGAPAHDLPTLLGGAAYVFDLVAAAWVQTAKLTPSDQPMITRFGWAVGLEGDRIVVGAPDDADVDYTGAAYLFEEGFGGWKETAKFYGSGLVAGDSFGSVIDLAGSEALIGAPHLWTDPDPTPGYTFHFDLDAADPSVLADATSVSLSQGGVQSLQLGACQDHAGDLYVLAGSATGTSPGFLLAGKAVPLNADPYFLFSLKHRNAPPLGGSTGVLDASGKANAAFALPPGTDPGLAGLVLHHAYCVLDAATLQVEAVSDAVPVALVP